MGAAAEEIPGVSTISSTRLGDRVRVLRRGLRQARRRGPNRGLPQRVAAAQIRVARPAPQQVFRQGDDWVEIRDADDFDPWDTLCWETVRVIRYRRYKPDGRVYEAYLLTDFPRPFVSRR